MGARLAVLAANVAVVILFAIVNVIRHGALVAANVAGSVAIVIVNVRRCHTLDAAGVTSGIASVTENVRRNGAYRSASITALVAVVVISVRRRRASSTANIAICIAGVIIKVIATAREEIVKDKRGGLVGEKRAVSLSVGVICALVKLLCKYLNTRGGINVSACGNNKVNVSRGINELTKLCGGSGAVTEDSVLDLASIALAFHICGEGIGDLRLISRTNVVLIDTNDYLFEVIYTSFVITNVAERILVVVINVIGNGAGSTANVAIRVASVIVNVCACRAGCSANVTACIASVAENVRGNGARISAGVARSVARVIIAVCAYGTGSATNVAICIASVVVNVCACGTGSSAIITSSVASIVVDVCACGASSSANITACITSGAVNVRTCRAGRSADVAACIASVIINVCRRSASCTADVTACITSVRINVCGGSAGSSAIVTSSVASVIVNVNDYLAHEAASVAGCIGAVGINVIGNGALCSARIASSVASVVICVCARRASCSASVAGSIASIGVNVVATARKEIVEYSGTRGVGQERAVSLTVGIIGALVELLCEYLNTRGGVDVLICGKNEVDVACGINESAELCGGGGAVAKRSVFNVKDVTFFSSVSGKGISDLLLISRADIVLVNAYNDVVELRYRSCLSARVAGGIGSTAISVSRGSAGSGTNVTSSVARIIVEVVATARYEIIEQSCGEFVGKKCAVSATVGVILALVELLGDDLNASRGVNVESCGEDEINVACGIDKLTELCGGGRAVTERSVLDIAGVAQLCKMFCESIGDLLLVSRADVVLVYADDYVLKNRSLCGVRNGHQRRYYHKNREN
jgi:hypothetical protein